MSRAGSPDISLVMPCYNEQASLGYTVPRLISAFERAGYKLELVAVDNGSTDATAVVLQALAATWPSMVLHRVEKNEGYGNGVLSGIPRCTAPWIGIIPADGQVDAEDVVRLYDALATAKGPLLGKVRRRFRMDGFRRKLVSISYNGFIRLLWPGLGSIDVNGTPKILSRDVLLAMHLKSKDWFLDPEIMIKAHALGVRTLELNVFARMRGGGVSHVRSSTCWEFFRNLLLYRFTNHWKAGVTRLAESRQEAQCIGTITTQH